MASTQKRTFKVIQGGLSGASPEPAAPPPSSPGAAEEQRLQRAILQLVIQSTGLTVEQTLDEISDNYFSDEVSVIDRGQYLQHSLTEIGLRFTQANEEMDLERAGYLILTWPDRLANTYPELAPLHPLAHPYITIG